jgi:hypothetical protein
MIETKKHTMRSGSGAAHIGFRMFGARGPLLQEEGAAGGSSSGQAAGTQQTGSEANAQTNGNSGGEKTFTQADVDRIVKERLARAERGSNQQRQQQQTQQSSNEDGGEKLSLKALEKRLEESEKRRQFERKAAKAGISDETLDDAFDLYNAQKPDSMDTWFESKGKLFVAQQKQSATTQSSAQTANAGTEQNGQQQQRKVAAAPIAPGAAESFTDTGGLMDIYQMSPDKLAQLPPGKMREIHERNLRIVNQGIGAPPPPKFGMQQKG